MFPGPVSSGTTLGSDAPSRLRMHQKRSRRLQLVAAGPIAARRGAPAAHPPSPPLGVLLAVLHTLAAVSLLLPAAAAREFSSEGRTRDDYFETAPRSLAAAGW